MACISSQVTDKTTGRSLPLEVFFAAYPTAQFRSGAYLFKPDGHQVPPVTHSIDFGFFQGKINLIRKKQLFRSPP